MKNSPSEDSLEDFASLSGFRLRPLSKVDIPEFVEIGLPTCAFMHGRNDVPEKILRRNFTSFVSSFAFEDESKIFVVESPQGSLAAQLWLRVATNRFNDINELWIWDITVRDEFQRLGLGRALLRFAKQKAIETESGELWLLVSGKNDKASQLYKTEGLAISGHLMSLNSSDFSSEHKLNEIKFNSVILRQLTDNSVEPLYDLWTNADLPFKRSGRDHPDRLRKFLSSPRQTAWGAYDNDLMVGATLTSFDGRKGWIERLAILPDYRRAGLAKALISAATQTLQEAGALVIAALILDSNTASRRLFESCGYRFDPNICYYTKRENPDF